MIRACTEEDFEAVLAVINDGARAYRGVIPPDRLHDPYMTAEELRQEIADGIWDVYYSTVRLGQLDERTLTVEDAFGRTQRRPTTQQL